MKRNIANYLLFQLAWLGCLFSARINFGMLAILIAALLLILHVQVIGSLSDVRFVVLAAALGYASDTLLVVAGVLAFENETPLPAPLWMLAIWTCFATTIGYSLGWLDGRLGLAAILGGLAGPLAYLSSEKMGVVDIRESLRGIAYIAAEWFVTLPFLITLRKTIAGRRSANAKVAIRHV
ncbi:MAG: DUF2878 domain-containing protein [Phycisphaerae bacterium]